MYYMRKKFENGNQKPEIEEGQKMQWPNEKGQIKTSNEMLHVYLCSHVYRKGKGNGYDAIVQLYLGRQLCWWEKPEYREKTTDIPKLAGKLYHIMLYLLHLAMSRIRTHNFCGDMH